MLLLFSYDPVKRVPVCLANFGLGDVTFCPNVGHPWPNTWHAKFKTQTPFLRQKSTILCITKNWSVIGENWSVEFDLKKGRNGSKYVEQYLEYDENCLKNGQNYSGEK